jgi:imidazoleglycerol-phosphate dehydratase
MRIVSVERQTKETKISVSINLDGSGKAIIDTGVGFFDHMLTAFAVHGSFDLDVSVKGDLNVDCHHTIEDTGIVIGKAFKKALGDKSGILRYGNASIPMDEALATVTLDISGRPFLVFNCEFGSDRIGDFDTQMCEEFFRAFAFNSGITLHANVAYGTNDHHKVEALFKALTYALKSAVKQNETAMPISTKGVL